MRAVGNGIGDAEVEVEIRDGPNLDHLVYDPVRIEQLILNGLSNASKYSPAGSTIRIVLEEFPNIDTLIAGVRHTESLPTSSILFAVSAHPKLTSSTPVSEVLGQQSSGGDMLTSSPSHLEMEETDAASMVWVRIRIIDEGPGLQGESASRLFRRFEQSLLQATAETSAGAGGRSLDRMRGRGLGLSMVARLTVLGGGAVALRDRSDGHQGCVFDLVLPMAIAVRSRTTRSGRGRTAPKPADALIGKAALVADDQPLIRRMMTRTLKRLGAKEIVVAESGETLLEILSSSPPKDPIAAAFLDQDMGEGWSGFETAKEIRAIGYTFPIVLVSGNPTDLGAASVKDAGVTHALRKPFAAKDVETLLRTWGKEGEGTEEGGGGE